MYIRCVGLLTKCTDINQFRQFCHDLIITSVSNTESIIIKEKNNCFNAQQRLIQLIKSDKILYDTNCETNLFDDNLMNELDNDECDTKIMNFLQNLQSKNKTSNTEGERPNPY